MAIAQAAAYGLHTGWAAAVPRHQHPIKLLCGAITDSAHDGWRDAAADNGLFEVCDGLSYHSYRPPQDEEKLAAVFRNWLASRDGHGGFPLMVTTQRSSSFDLPLYGALARGLLVCAQITEAGTQSDDWKASSGDKCSAAKPQCPAGFYCYNDACVGKMRPTHVVSRHDISGVWVAFFSGM